MFAFRLAMPLVCALWPLTAASALAQEQEEETAEADCTAWILDITNHTAYWLAIYEYLGEKLVQPANLTQRQRGDRIHPVRPHGRNSTLLFAARPAVMILSVKGGEPVVLGLASPQQQRSNAGSDLSQKMTLKFTCASD